MKVESPALISFPPDAGGYACVVIVIHPNQSIVYENCAWRNQTGIDNGTNIHELSSSKRQNWVKARVGVQSTVSIIAHYAFSQCLRGLGNTRKPVSFYRGDLLSAFAQDRICSNMRFLTTIIPFAFSSVNVIALASESPFAISVLPTTIYASRYNGSDSIEILRYPTTMAFQEFYNALVLTFGASVDDQRDMHSQEVIINSTLKPAIEAWEKQLGVKHFPDVHAFFISSVFDWSFRTPAAEVVFPPYIPERASKEGPAEQAAFAAYGFNECKNLGRQMEECKDEGPENMILTLEYEREYLYIWIQVVDFEMGICPVHCKRFIRELGESYREARRSYSPR
jgi:hypothetical protein